MHMHRVCPPNILAQFAAELGKGVAMGLMVWGPLANPTVLQGGVGDRESKQGYCLGGAHQKVPLRVVFLTYSNTLLLTVCVLRLSIKTPRLAE